MANAQIIRLKAICFQGMLGTLFFTHGLMGQDLSGRFGIGVIGSAVKMIGGQRDRSTIDQWAGVQFHYGYAPALSFNTSVAYGWVYPRDPSGSQFTAGGGYKTLLIPLNLNLVYCFFHQSRVRPFLSLGAGLTNWDIRRLGKKVTTFSRGTSINKEQLNATLIGGLGLELIVLCDYALNMIVHYHRLLKGNEDTIGYGDDGNNGIAEVRIGLARYWGGFKDQDKDGVADKHDLDPLHAEDFDQFQDHDGAPDPDNDRDGIPDIHDRAPYDPEDIDGYLDKDGIPDLDNDGDTIPDKIDKCPNQAEDFDDFEDRDGCPDFDNDKDYIPDSLDQCPNWSEDFNGYLDEDGCPDEKPEPEPEPLGKGKSITLKGANFETGSAQLKPESYTALNEFVSILKDHPNIEIEIRGYTDNTGNFQSNQNLSQRRAETVKRYLIDHGIEPARLNTIGLGELNPIADNLTREGRAANRRIEIVRLK